MNTIDIYLKDEILKNSISFMRTFGVGCFKRATIIKEIHLLESIVHLFKSGNISEIDFLTRIQPYTFDWIIDHVRIITCFEYILKSNLLSKGYIIHNINGKKYQLLKSNLSNPSKKPILFSVLSELCIKNNIQLSDVFLPNTIPISKIIASSKYRKVLSTPSDAESIRLENMDTLIEINKVRNRIHFSSKLPINTSSTYLHELKELATYIEKIREKMLKHQNQES